MESNVVIHTKGTCKISYTICMNIFNKKNVKAPKNCTLVFALLMLNDCLIAFFLH